MALDPSIILAQRPMELPNPLESAAKALTVRSLIQQGESNQLKLNQEKIQAQDQQSMRDAYKANTTVGPDGNPNLNNAGMMKDLTNANPAMAIKFSLDQKQVQLEQLQRQHAIAKDVIFSINDQASQDAAIKKAKELGLPPLDQQLPPQYDPRAVRMIQMRNLSAEEQIAQQNKEIEQQRQQQSSDAQTLGAQAKAYEAGLPSGKNWSQGKPGSGFSPAPKMKMKAMEDYNQANDSSRQRPDAAQALKDIQAAQKISEAISQAPGGDPNKLNNNQLRLVVGEVSKMATGGAPTEGEMESLTPQNVAQKYGGMLQKLTNRSTPANAGEFVKQFQDYANGIAKQGKDRLVTRSTEIADRLRPYLGEDQHALVKKQIANEFPDIGKDGHDYPIGSKAKTKSGVPVVYKGNGKWEPI